MSNTIRWFESAALDAPELNSPQPCPRGIHCNYMINISDQWEPGCCRGVHPGEEGNGRRLFPARTLDDGREQPACVRLTGMAGFYERRRLRLSWGQWCERQGIPFTPVKAGERWEPVVRSPLGGRSRMASDQHRGDAPKNPVAAEPRNVHVGVREDGSPVCALAPPRKLSKNQRKRLNKKRRLPAAAGTAEAAEEDARDEQRFDEQAAAYAYIHDQQYQEWLAEQGGLRSGGFRSGECSPDCTCTEGWMCGDRTEVRLSQPRYPGMAEAAAETLIVDTVESTMTCEQVEAELRAGAHSPKPVYPPQSLNLSWTPPRGGMPSNGFRCGECSPDCSCPYGWMCGDRSESREQDHDIASMVAAAAAASAAASSP